ncbi:MAG: PrgI family protein [Candidatus Staskawiczbacteria bacterium]|nr:PrgI family protein [Candidatus Staskawiczbacteria bacterium]MBI3337433.1 PrgI family protein [Candidatus Staskawiczbacteria bacterium]
MEQYPIPQFIEQEGKIISFVSFRQFFYIIGAGVICFLLYFVLPRFLFIILSVIIGVTAIVLAFVTVNGVPIMNVILSSFGFAAGSKNYVWQKKESPYPFKTVKRVEIRKIEEGSALKVQQSRLKKIHTEVELKTK